MRYPNPMALGSATLFSLLMVGGCGGNSAPSETQSAGTVQHVGDATIKFVGQPRAISNSTSNGVTIAGMSGASITGVSLSPRPKLTDLSFVYQTVSETYLATSPPAPSTGGYSGQLNSIPIHTTPVGGALAREVFTGDGRILYSVYVAPSVQLYISNSDGSGFTQFTKSSTAHFNPCVSPNNKLILFDDGTSLYTMPLTQYGTETKVPITGSAIQGTWSPDMTKIAYVQGNLVKPLGPVRIAPYPAGGAGTTFLASSATTNYLFPTWSPDGTKIAVSLQTVQSSNSSFSIETHAASNPNYVTVLSGSQGQDGSPSWTPDSNYLSFIRGASGQPGTMMLANIDGTGALGLIYGTSPSGLLSCSVSPFLSPVTYVGTGATLAATASGFLWSQYYDSFASMVAFSVKTPSTATITATSGNGGASVYDLHGDAITALSYTNGYYLPGTAISIGSGMTDVFVSFSALNGSLTTVAPFVVRAGSARPSVVTQGSTIKLTGSFSGVWDEKRKNQAVNGASEIRLDAKTGKLISFTQ